MRTIPRRLPAAPTSAATTESPRIVSVESPESVILKDLAGAKPGDAESFQWVNFVRGDTMLMTLTNHQYLATKPNNPGQVTANALDISPGRKSGAEFKWKEVE